MKTRLLVVALFAAAAAMPVSARLNVDAPPTIDSTPDNVQGAKAKGKTVEERVTDMNRKNNENAEAAEAQRKDEDAQAQKDLDKAKVRSKNPSLWPKTKIEETVNNKNEVTEVKVTPMSTQIPYIMTRETQHGTSGSNAAGRDNTMSIPKFLNFGF